MGKVEIVRPQALEGTAAAPGHGVSSAKAFEKEGVWVGQSRIGSNVDSGWHHHGDHDTYFFVTAGRGRLESGPGGKDAAELRPGDVVLVPKGRIHRELTGPEELVAYVIRIGKGQLVFPAAGPE